MSSFRKNIYKQYRRYVGQSTGSFEVGVGNCNSTPTVWDAVFSTDSNIVNGDIIYNDINLTSPYNGGDLLYMQRIDGLFILQNTFNISTAGVVSNYTSCSSGGDTTNGEPVLQNTADNTCLRRFTGTFTAASTDTVQVTFKHVTDIGTPNGVVVNGVNMFTNNQIETFTGTVTYDTGDMNNREPVATQTIKFENLTTGEITQDYDISPENTNFPC